MYDTASELYDKFLDNYVDSYYDLEKRKRRVRLYKFKIINFKHKGYDYRKMYNEISDDDFNDSHDCKKEEFIAISDMPPLEDDEEEVKEGKALKILAPNNLLNKLSVILPQTKAGKNFIQIEK